MKNEKLNEKVINYFEMMIDEFCCGNDNEYKVGSKVSFLFEECEKGDDDLYDEEDVKDFFEVREFIKNENGEIKYIGEFNDKDLEYTFKVIGSDIECSWIEPKY
jgi:DNA-dependent RNA polymerase auxiliary subunit epsilon